MSERKAGEGGYNFSCSELASFSIAKYGPQTDADMGVDAGGNVDMEFGGNHPA